MSFGVRKRTIYLTWVQSFGVLGYCWVAKFLDNKTGKKIKLAIYEDTPNNIYEYINGSFSRIISKDKFNYKDYIL